MTFPPPLAPTPNSAGCCLSGDGVPDAYWAGGGLQGTEITSWLWVEFLAILVPSVDKSKLDSLLHSLVITVATYFVQFYYFSSALAPQDSTLPTPAVSDHNNTSYSTSTATRPLLVGYSSGTFPSGTLS